MHSNLSEAATAAEPKALQKKAPPPPKKNQKNALKKKDGGDKVLKTTEKTRRKPRETNRQLRESMQKAGKIEEATGSRLSPKRRLPAAA